MSGHICEWTRTDLEQITEIVISNDVEKLGRFRFSFDDDWEVQSLKIDPNYKSVLDISLLRTFDGKRVILRLYAEPIPEESSAINEGSQTDQVFFTSIMIDEFVGIVGLDHFEDGRIIDLVPGTDVSSLLRE